METYLIYYGKPITQQQWEAHCNGTKPLQKPLQAVSSEKENHPRQTNLLAGNYQTQKKEE